MKKTIFFNCVTGLVGLLFFSHALGMELYDDFSGAGIDKTRWKQGVLVREIDAMTSKLHLKAETPGSILMKEFPYSAHNELGIENPDSVTSLQAEVTVVESDLAGSARTYVYLGGRFYNVNASGDKDSYLGDVYAEVNIRGTSRGLEARWYIGKYRTSKSNLTDIVSRSFPITLEYGKPYILSIEFDSTARKFTFKAGSATATYGPAGVPRKARDASKPWKALGATARVYHAKESAFIWAAFDDVQVNGSPYDDFSSLRIDETKWITYDYVREISDGKFRSKVRSSTAYTDTVNSYLSAISAKSIETMQAKVTLLAYETSGGATAFARIAGNFYNDGTPGGGYTGEVGATVSIGGSDLNPKGQWSVYKFRDRDGNIELADLLASGEFSAPVVVGETYTLFLKWDGSRFLFRLDDEEAEYIPDPGSIRKRPRRIWRGAGCGIWFNLDGQEATAEALFDDVMVATP